MRNKPAPAGRAPLWRNDRDYIRVLIQDLQVEASVGMHPWEQHPDRPTRLIVNVEMFASAPPPGDSAGQLIDYDLVRQAVHRWPGRPHTLYLETLAEELVALCFQIERVEACRVSVVKPDIFNDAAGAGVEFYRLRHGSGS
jgi:dihydroneopterin aldolase